MGSIVVCAPRWMGERLTSVGEYIARLCMLGCLTGLAWAPAVS